MTESEFALVLEFWRCCCFDMGAGSVGVVADDPIMSTSPRFGFLAGKVCCWGPFVVGFLLEELLGCMRGLVLVIIGSIIGEAMCCRDVRLEAKEDGV